MIALVLQLWVSDSTYGPRARGDLVIDGASARISGLSATVRRAGDSVLATFPDSEGEFRGAIGSGGSLAGFWVQPQGLISRVEYATG